MKKQHIFYLIIGIAVLAILVGGAFYWFQLRPVQIKKQCWRMVEKMKSGESKIIDDGKFGPDDHERIQVEFGNQKVAEEVYSNCLRKNGL